VGLWNLATLPDARRRGAATAVTIAALEDARADGCRLAVLASTPAALSLYRRLGFEDGGRLTIAGRGAFGPAEPI
jgi:ribosomal protein S18 acetylase RimI-like enzyme